MTIESAVVLFCISMAGNLYQFWSNRKGRDLDAIKQQLELIQQLQKAKDKSYEEAMKRKEIQIKQLTDELNAQQTLIQTNAEEVKRMQRIITFLIANGCQEAKMCPDHCPYSIDDLERMVDERK